MIPMAARVYCVIKYMPERLKIMRAWGSHLQRLKRQEGHLFRAADILRGSS